MKSISGITPSRVGFLPATRALSSIVPKSSLISKSKSLKSYETESLVRMVSNPLQAESYAIDTINRTIIRRETNINKKERIMIKIFIEIFSLKNFYFFTYKKLITKMKVKDAIKKLTTIIVTKEEFEEVFSITSKISYKVSVKSINPVFMSVIFVTTRLICSIKVVYSDEEAKFFPSFAAA